MVITPAPLAPHIPHVHMHMHRRMHASIHAPCAPAHHRGVASLLTPLLAAQAPLARISYPRLKHEQSRCGGHDVDGGTGRADAYVDPCGSAAAACAAMQSLGLRSRESIAPELTPAKDQLVIREAKIARAEAHHQSKRATAGRFFLGGHVGVLVAQAGESQRCSQHSTTAIA